MDRKTAVFLATVGSVAVVVSLALTVTLWPEKTKVDRRANTGSSGGGATTTQPAGQLATAAPIRQRGAAASAPKSFGMTDLSGANPSGSPLMKSEIGTAQVLDPQTGKMKDVPFTAQIMVMTQADGKPIQVKGKAMGALTGTEASSERYANPTIAGNAASGSATRPARPDKQ